MACGPHMSAFSLSHLHVGSTCHHLPRSPRRHQLHATRPRYPAAPLLHSPRALPARGRPHRALALAELDRCGELPREASRAPVKVGCHGELSRGREWGHRRRLMLNSVAAASSYHHARRSSACATPVLAPVFPLHHCSCPKLLAGVDSPSLVSLPSIPCAGSSSSLLLSCSGPHPTVSRLFPGVLLRLAPPPSVAPPLPPPLSARPSRGEARRLPLVLVRTLSRPPVANRQSTGLPAVPSVVLQLAFRS